MGAVTVTPTDILTSAMIAGEVEVVVEAVVVVGQEEAFH